MDQEAGFFVRSQHRFSVPTWLPSGAARSRGQGWPDQRKGHRQRRLGLDGGEHGAKLGQIEATVDHGRQRRGTMATGLSFAGVPHHIFRLIIGRRSSPIEGEGSPWQRASDLPRKTVAVIERHYTRRATPYLTFSTSTGTFPFVVLRVHLVLLIFLILWTFVILCILMVLYVLVCLAWPFVSFAATGSSFRLAAGDLLPKISES